MTPLRLAIITRRFWPYCGPAEIEAAELAESIAQSGHHVEVITVRWEKKWPRVFRFREFDVTRIGRPIGGPWGMFRYLRNLNRHVRDANLDGLIVFGLHDESWAAIRNFAPHLPLLVRLSSAKVSDKSPRPFNSRQLAALRKVKQIFVDSTTTSDWLLQNHDINENLVSVVPIGVPIDLPAQRSSARMNTSRMALSDAHPVLQIDPLQPLVLCGTSQFADPGIFDLIDAWRIVLNRFPKARLWILGDGLKARAVWERICDCELADSIIMPGFFDDWTDVLMAADIYVHPLRTDVSCGALARALASGICIVASQTSNTQCLIENDKNGLLTPPADPAALAEALILSLEHVELRDRLGLAAQKRMMVECNNQKTTAAYLSSFDEACQSQELTEE